MKSELYARMKLFYEYYYNIQFKGRQNGQCASYEIIGQIPAGKWDNKYNKSNYQMHEIKSNRIKSNKIIYSMDIFEQFEFDKFVIAQRFDAQ